MGSVMSHIECPHCGQPNCMDDYYYKSGEEYIQCPDCGYYKSVEIKEDSRKKNYIDLTEEDWEMSELSKPYGSYRLKLKNTVGQCGSISSKSHLNHMLKNITEEIVEFTVSRLVGDKIVTVDIIRQMKLKKILKKNEKRRDTKNSKGIIRG